MVDASPIYLDKAAESLAGAESELANGRYNNCANRCYYACFQAAIAALEQAGIRPPGPQWSHTFVPGQFVGLLINRRRRYPSSLREVLSRNYKLREIADYTDVLVTQTEATRAVRRTREFVEAILAKGAER
jgi:uncharacterized protein (UPF0332 family)